MDWNFEPAVSYCPDDLLCGRTCIREWESLDAHWLLLWSTVSSTCYWSSSLVFSSYHPVLLCTLKIRQYCDSSTQQGECSVHKVTNSYIYVPSLSSQSSKSSSTLSGRFLYKPKADSHLQNIIETINIWHNQLCCRSYHSLWHAALNLSLYVNASS